MTIWVIHVVHDAVSSADDVQEVSVVSGVKGVDGVCEVKGVDGVCERIGCGIYQPCRKRGVWDMCLCLGRGDVGGVGGVGGWLGPEFGRVVWRYVYVCCESGLFA